MKYLFSTLYIVLVSFFLQSCDRYLITFNEQPIHQPTSLLTNFSLDDPSLEACIKQTVKDLTIKHREQLTRLQCSHAGITSLAGIDQFPYLVELNLSNNMLSNISPLLLLVNLERIDLSGNPAIKCEDIKSLANRITVDLKLPHNCHP